MSDNRKQLHNIWSSVDGENCFQEMMSFIESKYIPKEEHEKALKDEERFYNTKLQERQATDISFAVSHIEYEKDLEIQKLKEERDLLKEIR